VALAAGGGLLVGATLTSLYNYRYNSNYNCMGEDGWSGSCMGCRRRVSCSYHPPANLMRDDVMEGTGFIPADWEQNISVVIHRIGGYDSAPGGDYCPPADYKAPSPAVVTKADPDCRDGLNASSDGVKVCCAAGCGSCGGAGCSGRPGGPGECCTANIREANVSCADFPAPCVRPSCSRRLAVTTASGVSGSARRLDWAPTTDYPMIFMKFEQVDEFATVVDDVVSGAPSHALLHCPIFVLVVLIHLLLRSSFRR